MRFFGDMAAWELKVKFQHEVNNLIFKYRMLTLEQNTQPNSPTFNYYPPPISLQPPFLKVMVQYSCETGIEEVSIVTIEVWAVINGTVKTWKFAFLLIYVATGYKTL